MTEGSEKPNRKFLDITFWVGHLGLVIPFIAMPEDSSGGGMPGWSLVLFLVAILSLLAYFFAIGRFASNSGRSAIVWGGVSFIFSPLGIWISYIASFFIKPKPANDI